MPSRSATPGRKFSTTTSARAAIRRATATPAGCWRSTTIARLLRLNCTQTGPSPPRNGGPIRRALSPRGASTFTTSAPRSPSTWVQSGPETTVVKSNTRMPASGPRGAAPISTFMRHKLLPERARFLLQ